MLRLSQPIAAGACALALLLAPQLSYAGAQQYEPLAASVKRALSQAVQGDSAVPQPKFESDAHRQDWLAQMGQRLERKIPDRQRREELLLTAKYEAQRAGLDPQMVLGLITVESGFKRYAVSHAGALGLMQVMPFWTRVIGDGDPQRLFDMRTNLRYGCVILRHYIDIERGDLFRALGRYNGSLGKAEYPNAVYAAWKRWEYTPSGASPAR